MCIAAGGDISTHTSMPPKREASESVGTQPNVKEMRISTEAEEDSGENAEEKYRISNDTIYPAFEVSCPSYGKWDRNFKHGEGHDN